MIDFVTRNLAVISAAITALATSMALVFLFAYLSVFDWNLIWIVEYTDMIKFTIIGIAILSSSGIFVIVVLDAAYRMLIRGEKRPKYILTFMLLSIVIAIVSHMYSDYHSDTSHFEYHFSTLASYLSVAIFVFAAVGTYKDRNTFDKWNYCLMTVSIVTMVGLLGRTYGLRIRDGDFYDKRHEIILREQEGWRRTFTDAKIILITSHHTVLSVAGTVVIIPSSDIAQIAGHPP